MAARWAGITAGGLLAGAALVLLARWSGWQPGVLALAVSLSPYVVVAVVAAIGLAAFGRQWLLCATGVVLALLSVLVQLPRFTADADAGEGAPVLRMATSNLQYGQGEAAAVVALVREQEVDVLAVQELTPEAVDRLAAAGLDALLPHRYVQPLPRAGGTGMWSRWPLREQRDIPGAVSANLLALTDVPGVGPVTVGALHPMRPELLSSRRWRQDHALVRDVLDGLGGPVALAGDFNATLDHGPMRRLQADGYADAGDQVGAGLVRTWPHGLGVPALIGIDHVLTRGGLAASTVRAARIPGTDHGAVVATLTRGGAISD